MLITRWNWRRVLGAVLLFVMGIVVANHYLEWELFGNHSKIAVVATGIAAYFYLLRIAPRITEEPGGSGDRQSAKPLSKSIYWLFLLPVVYFFWTGPAAYLFKGQTVPGREWIRMLMAIAIIALAGVFAWRSRRLFTDKRDRD